MLYKGKQISLKYNSLSDVISHQRNRDSQRIQKVSCLINFITILELQNFVDRITKGLCFCCKTLDLGQAFKQTKIGIGKGYFIIDQQIARHLVHYSECLYTPVFLYNSINFTLFLLQGSEHDKGLRFQPIVQFRQESDYRRSIFLVIRTFMFNESCNKVIKHFEEI